MQPILERLLCPTPRQARWCAFIGFALFVVLMFWELLVPGGVLITSDDGVGVIQNIKSRTPFLFAANWDDLVLLGTPGGLAPVEWNVLLIWVAPIRLYINWVHAVDLLLASLFLAFFMRDKRIGLVGIIMGALAAYWLGSNLTLTYAGHLGKYGVLLFAGISLFCINRALAGQVGILWSILAGGAIGFMFLEQLDVALFFGFVLGAYALFLVIRQWRANGNWLKPVGTLAMMGGVGLLLAVTTMLGSYTSNVKGVASMQTESPQEKWDYVTQWSWPPDESIDFIAPGYMGWRSGEPEGPYWGRMGRSAGWEQTHQGFMNFKLENTYLGIIPILLALFAIFGAIMGGKVGYPQMTSLDASFSDRRAEIIFWGCVAVITLLLAFGKFFPLYALFYKLPMVSSIRNPNKFLQVFQLALGILTAYGFDTIVRYRTLTLREQARNVKESA